jgi:hypothetical protein
MPVSRFLYSLRGLGSSPTLLVLLVLLAGCQSAANRRRAFVEQFYAEDFRMFHDTYFLARGTDNEGNRVLGFFCPSAQAATAGDDLVAILVASSTTDSVLKVTYVSNLTQCTSVADSASFIKLARRFLRYRVASLGADTSGAVAVQFRPGQFGPSDLVRVSDTTRLTTEFHQEFSRVRGPWYERKAAD